MYPVHYKRRAVLHCRKQQKTVKINHIKHRRRKPQQTGGENRSKQAEKTAANKRRKPQQTGGKKRSKQAEKTAANCAENKHHSGIDNQQKNIIQFIFK
jgi:hypothetical protein